VLDEALTALAAAGGSSLVSAMVTDQWATVKAKFARLLGQGNTGQVAVAEERLERSRTALAGLSQEKELEPVAVEQAAVWRVRLADLLEDEPTAAEELRDLVEQMQALRGGLLPSWSVQQHMIGFGQAQQAVQGHGIQINTFGDQGEPGRRG
jgi:hypothetical protein